MVNDVTSNLTYDDTITLFGTVPVAAQPAAAEPILVNNAQRPLTPAEEAEIKKLVELIDKLNTAINGPGGLQDSRKTWQGILAIQNTTLDGLKLQLTKAQAGLKAAQDALKNFQENDKISPPSEMRMFLDAIQRAEGYLKGVQDSIAVVENLMKNIQQRIDVINGWIKGYSDQTNAAYQRIGEIKAAAELGKPSTPAPAIAFVPVPTLPSDAGDWRKPMPVIPGVTAPAAPKAP